MDELIAVILPFIVKPLLVILALVVGLFLVKWVSQLVSKGLDKTKLDNTLKPFVNSLISTALKVLLVISILGVAGVPTTSFAGVIAASGFAIGLAFSGTLSNFSGGVLLLTLRPFKVGDLIEVNGQTGVVEEINVLNTVLVTVDNKQIIMPNGGVSTATIVNYSAKPTRRVDLTFGVGYEQDIDKVIDVLTNIANAHPLISQDPAPFIKLSEHGDSAVFFVVRSWTLSENYWTVYFDLLEQVKKRFDAENISIPYPQMDVHVNNQ